MWNVTELTVHSVEISTARNNLSQLRGRRWDEMRWSMQNKIVLHNNVQKWKCEGKLYHTSYKHIISTHSSSSTYLRQVSADNTMFYNITDLLYPAWYSEPVSMWISSQVKFWPPEHSCCLTTTEGLHCHPKIALTKSEACWAVCSRGLDFALIALEWWWLSTEYVGRKWAFIILKLACLSMKSIVQM